MSGRGERENLFLIVSIQLSCQDVRPNSDYPSACSRCVPPPLQGLAGAAAKVIVVSQRPTLSPPSPVLAHHQ